MSPAVSFLIFLFSTSSIFSSVANAARKPVLDSDGNALRSGVQYYIVSTIWGAGGASLEPRSFEKPCPKLVVLNGFQTGVPVVFYPEDTNDTTVYESSDVNIQFVPGTDPYCQTSTTWKVSDYDPSSGKWWLTIGGEVGNPGSQTLNSWFRIRKGGDGYVFSFCPAVCDSCISLCNEINRISHDTKVRLGLAKGDGGSFLFMKASEAIKQVEEKTSE
ncbi:Detected protein of unknown function [Hibiscus syriacus]|uniref:21 kDa seed protein n=2 Tax=Hibiscus syriacus TaxID=106335 RepID=A0A6A2X185_HIBSY|nr:Detected protein of unknown function [Hibiscus syriacus]